MKNLSMAAILTSLILVISMSSVAAWIMGAAVLRLWRAGGWTPTAWILVALALHFAMTVSEQVFVLFFRLAYADILPRDWFLTGFDLVGLVAGRKTLMAFAALICALVAHEILANGSDAEAWRAVKRAARIVAAGFFLIFSGIALLL